METNPSQLLPRSAAFPIRAISRKNSNLSSVKHHCNIDEDGTILETAHGEIVINYLIFFLSSEKSWWLYEAVPDEQTPLFYREFQRINESI